MKRFSKIQGILQKLNKKTLIISSSVVAILCAGGLAVALCMSRPSVVTPAIMTKFAADLFKREEISQILDLLSDGSIESSVSKINLGDKQLFENKFAGGKLYFSKSSLLLDDVHLKSENLDISGEALLSDTGLYISENSILKGSYGTTYDLFSEQLENSIFAYGSGSLYEITNKKIYNALILLTKQYPEDEQLIEDTKELLATYIKDVYKIISKYTEFETEKTELKQDGKRMGTRTITLSYDENNLADITYALSEYLINDKNIVEYLTKHGYKFRAILELHPGLEFNEGDSMIDIYNNYLSDVRENLDLTYSNIKNSNIDVEIRLVTPRGSYNLLSLVINNGENEIFGIDLGSQCVSKSKNITLKTKNSKFIYSITRDDDGGYESFVKRNRESIFSVKIDRENNIFETFLNIKNNKFRILGGIESEDGVTVINLSGVEHTYRKKSYDIYLNPVFTDATDCYETDLKITISTQDTTPTLITDFRTIDTVKESDIKRWIGNLANIII